MNFQKSCFRTDEKNAGQQILPVGKKKEPGYHSLTVTDSPLCVLALFICLLDIQDSFDVLSDGT